MKSPFYSIADFGKHTVGASNLNGSAVDMKDFDEYVQVTHSIHNAAKSASRTLDGKLQESDNGTSDWTDIPGGAITQIGNIDTSLQHTVISVKERKRYWRMTYQRATSGSSFIAFCSIVGYKQKG